MKVVITSGGTTEQIDDVRVITNKSTGRLGAAIACAYAKNASEHIEKIYYICGKGSIKPESHIIEHIDVLSVDDLKNTLTHVLESEDIDIVIHAMAVSDYRVSHVTNSKTVEEKISSDLKSSPVVNPEDFAKDMVNNILIKKPDTKHDNKISSEVDNLIIVMEKTPKVINLIKKISPNTILVGFKLLSNATQPELIEAAYSVLVKNGCDFVLANDQSNLSMESHAGYLVSDDKSYIEIVGKSAIAKTIVAKTIKKVGGKD